MQIGSLHVTVNPHFLTCRLMILMPKNNDEIALLSYSYEDIYFISKSNFIYLYPLLTISTGKYGFHPIAKVKL